jgi:hypothetical protein
VWDKSSVLARRLEETHGTRGRRGKRITIRRSWLTSQTCGRSAIIPAVGTASRGTATGFDASASRSFATADAFPARGRWRVLIACERSMVGGDWPDASATRAPPATPIWPVDWLYRPLRSLLKLPNRVADGDRRARILAFGTHGSSMIRFIATEDIAPARWSGQALNCSGAAPTRFAGLCRSQAGDEVGRRAFSSLRYLARLILTSFAIDAASASYFQVAVRSVI